MSEFVEFAIDLPECHLCGQEHRGVPVMPYGTSGGRKHPFATHWYTCPVQNAPMTLVYDPQVGTVDNEVVAMLAQAMLSGRWMVAVAWEKPTDPANIEYRRKTFDFERVHFGQFMELASRDLGEEYCGGMPKQQLQTVKLPAGLRLFSRFRPQEETSEPKEAIVAENGTEAIEQKE